MSGRAPRIRPSEIVAGVRLDPSGAHQLEVAVPSGVIGMCFARDQVDQLERAIKAWREVVAFDDVRTTEIYNPRFIPLEVR